MLGTVAPTPYDLRFSLFGIPVRVHPLFWLVSAIMGWGGAGGDLKLVALWIACVFVSILIHELGHAWTAKSYGWPPHIVLYAFGGYASYQPTWGHSTGKTILVLFAGPGAGFIFYAFIVAFEKVLDYQGIELTALAQDVISDLKWINLGWGLFNLLPVYPLDGGQISHAALSHFFPRSGSATALKISLVVAVGIAAIAFSGHQTYIALLFGSLAFENFQMLQRPRYW
jgi:membrane-associated protease RseP (regulator of RpoE activity)